MIPEGVFCSACYLGCEQCCETPERCQFILSLLTKERRTTLDVTALQTQLRTAQTQVRELQEELAPYKAREAALRKSREDASRAELLRPRMDWSSRPFDGGFTYADIRAKSRSNGGCGCTGPCMHD